MTDQQAAIDKEINEGRRKSLLKAGVGAAYLDRNLASTASGEDAVNWMRSTGYEGIIKGKTLAVETQMADGIDVLTLLARVIHLKGTGIRLTTLGNLVRLVETRYYEALGEMFMPSVLFVTRFFETPSQPTRTPTTYYQGQQIEDMLLERLAGGRANILHVANPGKHKVDLRHWWNEQFIDATGIKERLVLTK